ncbi:hypothetical protein CLCR_11023 [Cladophialophora carrionii]|uniref:Uncharacterized protein n=1 Tax=Cladophialophora carrionii TaxID=86049 RepID=A0A1C1CWL8_9EURO|nr:hypothetical protein CLCR_11023 [Cladophialophora carrionii]
MLIQINVGLVPAPMRKAGLTAVVEGHPFRACYFVCFGGLSLVILAPGASGSVHFATPDGLAAEDEDEAEAGGRVEFVCVDEEAGNRAEEFCDDCEEEEAGAAVLEGR